MNPGNPVGPTVSVVVPTFARPESLLRCLAAVRRQSTAPVEVVVVVRAEDADTRAAVASLADIVVIVVRRPGAAHAVESGIAAATAEVVAITDDDAEPHSDWVERISAAYAEDPRLGAFGGRDLMTGNTDVEVPSHAVGKLEWWGRVTGRHHRGVGPAVAVDHLKGVNLTVRRELVAHVPLGDLLRGGGAQYGWELFLTYTVLSAGWHVRYDPALLVDHHVERRRDGSERAATTPRQVRTDTFNVVSAARTCLPARRYLAVTLFMVMAGEPARPGLIRVVRSAIHERSLAPFQILRHTAAGVLDGWRSQPEVGVKIGRSRLR